MHKAQWQARSVSSPILKELRAYGVMMDQTLFQRTRVLIMHRLCVHQEETVVTALQVLTNMYIALFKLVVVTSCGLRVLKGNFPL